MMPQWEKDLLFEDVRLYGMFCVSTMRALLLFEEEKYNFRNTLADTYAAIAYDNAKLIIHLYNRIARTLQGDQKRG